SIEMPKTYSPRFVEPAWYEWWESRELFKPQQRSNVASTYSMVVPPPNVTGSLHLGHALTSAIEDVIIRWQRMLGNEVVWIPGSDHAGIATQMVVERFIENKYNLTRSEMGRERFEEAIWDWRNLKGDQIIKQLRRLGSSLDWDRSTFTLNPSYSYAVNEAFIRLHKEGLIYRDSRMINWCCHLGTSVSDLEVDRTESETPIKIPGYELRVDVGVMHNVAYQLDQPEIIVGTTRLETIPGDTAIAVNPSDPRYSHLIGRYVKHPLFDHKLLPIIADDAVVMDKGTGALKVTPAHSFLDFEIGKRHNLPHVSCINPVKCFSFFARIPASWPSDSPEDCGLCVSDPTSCKIKTQCMLVGCNRNEIHRFDMRNVVLKYLYKKDLYRSVLNFTLRICSRSGDLIEPMVSEQWFVRIEELADSALKAVDDGRIKFVQDGYMKQWRHWLTTSGDWCISRSLWWGHQIPVYLCRDNSTGWWISAHSEEAAREQFGAYDITITRDTDVLDTWFSSALFPFAALGWPKQTPDFQRIPRFYPLNLMETGNDLIFFWVARMVMLGMKLTGKVPFRNILLHPLIRDEVGRKMSKSLGNVIDPIHIIDGASNQVSAFERIEALDDLYLDGNEKLSAMSTTATAGNYQPLGCDSLRLAMCSYSTESPHINFNLTMVIESRKFLQKIWNSAIFVLSLFTHDEFTAKQVILQNGIDHKELTSYHRTVDKWVLAQLYEVVVSTNDHLSNHNLPAALRGIQHFWKNHFCSVYVEFCKSCFSAVTNENGDTVGYQASTNQQLAFALNILYVTETALRLMSPFTPFFTEELWQRLPKEYLNGEFPESITIATYPQAKDVSETLCF
uniref:Valine--tRNA ligase, mitochondrial n=1 Tax=Ciona savignyi TaxID=51511 RepID=H2Y6H7_CIOSA